MKSLFFKFIFLASFVSPAIGADFNCENIVGDWESRRYDETLEAYTVTNASYSKDSSWSFQTYIQSLATQSIHSESGRWECVGSDFLMHVQEVNGNGFGTGDEITHRYKILNLDYNFFRFEVATENCADTISDCKGVVFESTRRAHGS